MPTPSTPDHSTLTSGLLRGYETDIGDGSTTKFVVPHNLQKNYPTVVVVKNVPYSAVPSNLFPNPVLATDSSNWLLTTGATPQGTITTAARATMPDGSDKGFHVLATKNDDTAFGGFGPSTPNTLIAATPGLPYSIFANVYGVQPPPDNGWRAELQWLDSAQNILSTSLGAYVPGTTGKRQRVSLNNMVAPTGAAYVVGRIRGVSHINLQVIEFYVTGLVIVQASSVPLPEPLESCTVEYLDENTLQLSSEAWTASPPATAAYHVAVGS